MSIVSNFTLMVGNGVIPCSSLGGAFCHGVQKFVSLNELRFVEIYDIKSGLLWRPDHLKSIDALTPIHAGTGFAVQQQHSVDLVDIESGFLMQSLDLGPARAEDSQYIF